MSKLLMNTSSLVLRMLMGGGSLPHLWTRRISPPSPRDCFLGHLLAKSTPTAVESISFPSELGCPEFNPAGKTEHIKQYNEIPLTPQWQLWQNSTRDRYLTTQIAIPIVQSVHQAAQWQVHCRLRGKHTSPDAQLPTPWGKAQTAVEKLTTSIRWLRRN